MYNTKENINQTLYEANKDISITNIKNNSTKNEKSQKKLGPQKQSFVSLGGNSFYAKTPDNWI